MTRFSKIVYTGLCVGGPMAKQVLNSVNDRRYPVAKMEKHKGYPIKVSENDTPEYTETRRGLYEYDVGIWWWRGWNKR